ncbi:hypothetical protein TSO352_27655 [Azospirillum sp. TSO35-2]|nr:hypothetical protein TSO352_27655 [Azospirillum sp. TSO35-2]
MGIHPNRIEASMMGIALLRFPIAKWVWIGQLIPRAVRMAVPIALEAHPYLIGVLSISIPIHRVSCGGVYRHAERRHQPFEAAFGGHAIKVIGICQAACLEQTLGIVQVPLVRIQEIRPQSPLPKVAR